MTGLFIETDHLVILARDLGDASRRMARLDFTVSPRGFHGPKVGSAKHTITLVDDHVQFLGVVGPTDHIRAWREPLAKSQALNSFRLRSTDVWKACANLRAIGIVADLWIHRA